MNNANCSHTLLHVGPCEESSHSRKRHHGHGQSFCVKLPHHHRPICLDVQSDETKQIITNNAIIAVNQDSNGSPASRIWKKSVSEGGDIQLWSGSLANKYCLHICYPDKYTNPQNTTPANSSLL